LLLPTCSQTRSQESDHGPACRARACLHRPVSELQWRRRSKMSVRCEPVSPELARGLLLHPLCPNQQPTPDRRDAQWPPRHLVCACHLGLFRFAAEVQRSTARVLAQESRLRLCNAGIVLRQQGGVEVAGAFVQSSLSPKYTHATPLHPPQDNLILLAGVSVDCLLCLALVEGDVGTQCGRKFGVLLLNSDIECLLRGGNGLLVLAVV